MSEGVRGVGERGCGYGYADAEGVLGIILGRRQRRF